MGPRRVRGGIRGDERKEGPLGSMSYDSERKLAPSAAAATAETATARQSARRTRELMLERIVI